MSIDDYRVLRELGGGGFGKAYLVEARKVNGKPKRVLKHLQVSEVRSQKEWEIFVRLFKKEAKILGLLGQHPQIPSLYEYIYEYGNFFLVQEYVKGCLLSREIQTGNKLSEAKVLYLIEEILVILKFVHDQGAIHLDLKPDNIIRRTSDGKLVLIDFGGAKQTSALQITPGGGTKSTDCVGTKGYMPAEQAMGRPKPASDIYAVGKIGIQALTGIHPYRIPEDPRTGKILWEDLVDGVSKDLTDLLNKMTQYHFSERYHDASDALKAVRDLKNKNLNFNFQPFDPNFMLQVPITPIQPKPINPIPDPPSPSPGGYSGNVPKENPGINVQPDVPPKQQNGRNSAKEDEGFRVMMFFLITGFYGASGFVHTAMNAPLLVSGSFIASITTSIIYTLVFRYQNMWRKVL